MEIEEISKLFGNEDDADEDLKVDRELENLIFENFDED